MHPCADTFVSRGQYAGCDKVWPLIVCMCENCGHVQTRYRVSQDTRYKETEYSFVSSHSESYRKYWNEFALKHTNPGQTIVELGCNDGYLLKKCEDNGCHAFGIDPSEAMVTIALARGLDVFCGYFEDGIISRDNCVDLLIACNVLNHVDNIQRCMETAFNVLKDDGRFVIQVPSWSWMVENGGFDQVYHEHVHYFSVASMASMAKRFGFTMTDVELVNFHGVSMVVTLRKGDVASSCDVGTHPDVATITIASKKFDTHVERLQSELFALRAVGRTVFTLGASAKGNTLLTCAHATHREVKAVLEVSDRKIDKFTPLSRIPIVDEGTLAMHNDPVVVLTTRNLPTSVVNNLKRINPTTEVLAPFSDEVST